MRTLLISLAAFLLPFGSITAQDLEVATITTERPTVGTTPDIIVPFSAQLESGTNLAYSSKNYAIDLPESLLRIGVGSHAELRFKSTNFMNQSDAVTGTAYMQAQDLAFSAKVGLTETHSAVPQTVLVALSCPTGGSAQTSGSYDPSAILIWEQSTRGGLTIIENVGFLETSLNAARTTEWLPSVLVERAFTKKLGWAIEYAPTFVNNLAILHVLDGAVTYNPSPSTQFDLRIGYQDDPSDRHNLLSFGYSFRLSGLNKRPYSDLR